MQHALAVTAETKASSLIISQYWNCCKNHTKMMKLLQLQKFQLMNP